ncbi:ribosome biogenesis factor YjgA [Pseudohaliea rubra]|uniref:Dual-action ribosomal maturation protein DarP n=1 Tax=Pseudohaliea rubra DSM 19751 TaxID=1265313 RepID=A0A095VQ33_9GAMM|nr:ribosome biogenesis factor YjgA [Pseudohaliea rubra]KGE03218.1 putative alpha helix protein [Pseudohaliea rubra DSM 19751]
MVNDDRNSMDDAPDDADEAPSKSALKREMTARQNLGEALCALSPRELAAIPIEDPALAQAIAESRNITSRSARRRHLQFIGKLMRTVDPAPLQAGLDGLYRQRAENAAQHHELEALRDTLIDRGDAGLPAVLERFPEADRQHLRQLLRQARREQEAQRPPAAARKLFRYLRELQSAPG